MLETIPSYAMSCFKIPSSCCKEIEQLFAKFWWKSSYGSKGIHWAALRSLYRPKCFGGFGFRSMVEFNKALVAKQVWRIFQYPDSLMARILKAKYFPHMDIMDASLGYNPSYIWRSIILSRDLISKGLIWR